MLPETSERYLSTILFEGVSEGSDEEPVGLPQGLFHEPSNVEDEMSRSGRLETSNDKVPAQAQS